MKKSSHFSWLAKCKTGSLFVAIAAFWLIFPSQVFTLAPVVNKYVTTYSVRNDSDGRGDWGFVFNFNNAKANGGTEADISETACRPESTNFTFPVGDDGFVGTRLTGVRTAFSYVALTQAIQARLTRRNLTETWKYERAFFYDCGQPSTVSFSLDYQITAWLYADAIAMTNKFSVVLVKPDTTSIVLVADTNLAGIIGWTNKSGTIAATDFAQSGTYKLQILGQFKTVNTTGPNLTLQFDNINLSKASQFTDYRNDVEFTIKAAPYSSLGSGAYTLEVRAHKEDAASDNVQLQVFDGAAWNTRATISNTVNIHATNPDYTFTLSTAEYNNGAVRVRYVDTNVVADDIGGGIKIDYHRIKVDQGVCVDLIQSTEADCGKCHNYGGDITKPWPNTGMHNQHAQSETVADCKWCHPDFTNNGAGPFNMSHSDSIVTINGSKMYEVATTPLYGGTGTYARATTKTCSNSNCHYNLLTPAWNAVYGTNIERNCSRCHNTGTASLDNATNLNIATSWPTTKAHAQHDLAFKMDEFSCQSNGSCHPDNRTQHSAVGDGSGASVKMAPNFKSPTGGTLKYLKEAPTVPNDGKGRCYNTTCHGGVTTPMWDIAIAGSGGAIAVVTQCTKCHINEFATTWVSGFATSAKQYNSSISGLHRGTTPTSEMSHASAYACTICHNGEPPQHFKKLDGTTGLDSYLPVERPPAGSFVATLGYAAGVAAPPDFNNGTQGSSCSVNIATCHAETTTSKTTPSVWAREWSWRAYSETELDKCQVCHGHWGTFKAGVVQPHVNSNNDATQRAELIGSHTDSGNNCGTMCHAQSATTPVVYNHGVLATATSKTSDVNVAAGFVDNGTSVGCTGCHASNDGVGSGLHAFTDAAWATRNLLNGPAVLCSSCHGGGTSQGGGLFNYWPDGTTNYPDRPGEHSVHIQKLATKLGYTLGALTDQQQKTICAFCHTYTTNPGEAGHADNVAPATLSAGSFNPLWSVITTNYPSTPDGGTVGSYTAGNGTDGVCSNVDCHNNRPTATTPTANDWYDASTSSCIMCHTNAPADASHVAHTTASTTFGIPNLTCANCHDAATNWGTNTPPAGATHINGTFTATNYTGFTYPGTKGSCGVNTCHNNGKNLAAPVYTWGTPLTGCGTCHAVTPATQSHTAHLQASFNTTFGFTAMTCNSCHTVATVTSHINGTINIAGYTYGGDVGVAGTTYGGCSLNTCHNNGKNAPTPAYTWGTTLTNCTECHLNTALATQSHGQHLNCAATFGVANMTCNSCHTAATVATHGNGTVNIATYTYTGDVLVTGTTFGNCGLNTCHNNGKNAAFPAYTWGTTMTNCQECHGNNAATLTSQAHVAHLNSAATFGLAVACGNCHTAATLISHINGTINLPGTTTFTYTGGDVVVTGTTFGSCGTNNCHRSDASANTAPVVNPLWNAGAQPNCSICHLEVMTSNKHNQHMISNSLPNATNVNECYVCHNSTATAGGLATGANHMNAADNVNFNTTYAYEATTATVTGVGAAATCSNTKCHNGVTTPAWNAAIACGSCHNTTATGPLPSAASVAGKHAKHANNDAVYTDCAQCHPNAASYTFAGGHADHQNLAVATNVIMTGITYADAVNTAGGINYAAAGATHTDDGTCTSSTGCHGATTLTGGWAAAATLPNGCYACHGGSLTATEGGTTKPAVDAIPNPVNNAQYTAQGHGAATFTGSGVVNSMSASFVYTGAPGCYNCHDSASQHTPAASGTDPFRLGATYAANTNAMCIKNGCHDTPAIATHAKSIVGGTTTWVNNYDYKCVDCHDPHGDTNYYMVRSHISAPTTTGDLSFGSDQYGTPLDTVVNMSAVTFTSLTGNAANSYGIDTATNGICEVCHIDTAEVLYYRRGVAETNTHNTAGKCTSCHKHDAGFKGSPCSECHGGGTAQAAGTFNYWPDGTTITPDRPGEHLVHITRLAAKLNYPMGTLTDQQQKTMCAFCHVFTTAPGESGHHLGGAPADLNATSFNPIWSALTANYPSAADNATVAAAYTPGNGTGGSCSGIDCHNNRATATTSEWYDASTGNCLLCHTNDGSGTNNPTSGLHFGPLTVSATPHDDTFGPGGTCVSCHTVVPVLAPASTHMNSTFTANDITATNEYYTYADYTDAAVNSGSCLGATTGAAGCHGIDPIDAGTWARKWSTTAKNANGTECANCHGGFNSDWTFGSAASTTDYQVSHTRNWDGDAFTSEVIGNHSANTTNTNKCNICHVYGDAEYVWATYHRTDRKITLNSRFTYADAAWNCTAACHTGTGNNLHNLEAASSAAWATRGNTVLGPVLTCTSCHSGSGAGALGVGPASAHVKVLTASSFGACTDCHNNHTGVAVGGVIIPNNLTVGINYSTTGHTGIQLGGTGTVASINLLTTQAAICWGCHDEPGNLISEFGANTDPSTGNSTYNYGTLSTYDWTTANWSSSRTQFAFKTGAIQSTHTANPTVTDAALGGANYSKTETKNTAIQINCSNCHDVHELGLATGDKKEGKPFLRGSWMGNPYEEDGPPRSVYAGTAYFPNVVFPAQTYGWGAVPRGSKLQTRLGGYWIDQNNVVPMSATTTTNGTARNNPTATWEPLDTNAEAGNNGATSPAFAGLCLLCHGTGGSTALKIDGLDQLGTEALWMGTNGHANSVKGGTGSASANSTNVFDARLGVTTFGHNPRQHYDGMALPGDDGTIANDGFRAASGTAYAPAFSSSRAYGYNIDTWVVDETGATKESGYHKFSCSKCHNPHASRLPKLMITNCLDTVHNTWDNQFQLNGQTGNNLNTELAQWTSAQNCHRYSQSVNATAGSPELRASRVAGPAGTGAGWNKVTPWKQTTTTP